ncbi:MAG: hypothetical protein KC636_04275, partial [Myxococcales bacterium]|nr:hypothetical protein [Myxococcales bacterium]
GRQFEMSGLDWYAFDGAWIRAHTPAYFAVEVFSGLQVDGQQVFGYPTVELDGTAGTAEDRGYRWMIGTALSASGISWLDARVAWRRTWSPEALNANISADDGTQGLAGAINQDLVSASVAGLAFGGRLTPYAALRYNLGTSRLDDVTFGVQAAITERHTIRALYLRTNPSFDLDSVFNLFTFEPIDDARLVYEVRPGKRWTLAARGQMRLFSNAATAEGLAPEGAVEAGFGGGASAQFRIPRFAARVDGYGLGGEGGVRAGGSIDTRTMVAWDRLGIDARVYGNYYDDVDALARRGYGLAFQAGLNARLWRGIHLALLGEELLSTHYTQAFRLLATLSIEWSTRFGR